LLGRAIELRKRLGSRSSLRPNSLPEAFPINARDDSPGDGRFCGLAGKRDPSHLTIPVCADPLGCDFARCHNGRREGRGQDLAHRNSICGEDPVPLVSNLFRTGISTRCDSTKSTPSTVSLKSPLSALVTYFLF